MALVSEIQLQNGVVVPEKINDTRVFTMAGLSATQAIAIGETLPIDTTVNQFVIKSGNNIGVSLDSSNLDGSVDFTMNNDSNIAWNINVSNDNNDSFILRGKDITDSYFTHLSITKTGNFGIGTSTPSTNTIGDFIANNSASANITLRNTTDGTILKLGAETNKITLGSESNNNVDLKVNDLTVGTFSSGGLDLAEGTQFTVNGIQVLGGFAETLKGWPSLTVTGYDAYKIYFLDLDEQKYVWDIQYAKRVMRKTSWYNELGWPTQYGFLTVSENRDEVRWIDRSDTGTQTYISFERASGNVLGNSIVNDIFFLDFILYIATNEGLIIVDFIKDQMTRIDGTPQTYKWDQPISDRNSGNGNWVVTNNVSGLPDSNVNDLSVVRDLLGEEDLFGRPYHYSAISTGSGTDGTSTGDIVLMKPSEQTENYMWISQLSKNIKGGKILRTDNMWWIVDGTTEDQLYFSDEVNEIKTNGYGEYYFSPSQTLGRKLIASSTDHLNLLEGFPQGFLDGSVAIFSYAESNGLYIIHNDLKKLNESAHIIVRSDYITPYMKADRVAAWPLGDLNDVSGNSLNLTNNNTVTFSNSSAVYNNKATFDGINKYLSANSSSFSSGTDPFMLSLWVKSNTTSNPGLKVYPIQFYDTADNFISLYFTQSTGYMGIEVQDGSGSITTLETPYDAYDAEWHHVVLQRNTDDELVEFWVDGILIGSSAFVASAVSNPTNISIGGNYDQTAMFNGEVSSVYFGKQSYMKRREIQGDYYRGKKFLDGMNTMLTSNDIDSIKVDIDSGFCAVVVDNIVNFVDVKTGLVYFVDNTTGIGSVLDADIRTLNGAFDPHYLVGATDAVKIFAVNTIVS